ncbi:superfamily I DNA and RNA helicase [Rhodoferax ferrireducens]|uniref:DNA 3'-5' helicase II n=1 Tax=Rhodoferax ferrireducens TaxID=192843 RepID=A0ABU2CGF8_9BURK|nr:ATP-binding domain-containing protein [Rhodoferax ferrireducens]MDR7380416.1 superfamily I DNA and RNA helicase [Rhodoferax ferrireducens]
MPLDILVTTDRLSEDPIGRDFINHLQSNATSLQLDNAALYYDFPTYSDYETVTHKPDALLLSPIHGIIALRFLNGQNTERQQGSALVEVDESLGQFCSILIGRLLKSKSLRLNRSSLSLKVIPVIFCTSSRADDLFEGAESEIVSSLTAFDNFLNALENDSMSTTQFSEARSVLEGAKALNRANKRVVEDPNAQRAAAALAQLETEIANFDHKQRRAALVTINGPQRIRGLAGSGKTVILAMKAAHLHMTKPNEKILVTFFTKSLRSPIKDLITKFYRHYKEVDPDWNNIHIRHGWGGSKTGGAYSDACTRSGIMYRSFDSARNAAPAGIDPFDFACKELLSRDLIEPFYDHVLIDEGQDFPEGFYQLIFEMTHGHRDKKNIVWAYDELQNILNVRMRTPEELFGLDTDGSPRISLSRSEHNIPPGATNDTVLSKCYRNQREVLVTAHALGFGIYSQIVQLLESPEHWQDVGYEVNTPQFSVGQRIEILRPEENSPVSLHGDGLPLLIDYHIAPSINDEVKWVIDQTVELLGSGLQPEDFLVVALDDRNMRSYFKLISAAFAEKGISTNNIHADPYSEPPFTIPGKITLSTVYRAKGNEAAVVFAIGVDALSLNLRSHRNRLFAAFTRTKAWLRVSGMNSAQRVAAEIESAAENFPYLRFDMPDLSKINLIQRDLSQRSMKAKRIRKEYFEKLKTEGFSEDEISDLLSVEEKNAAS